MASTDLVAAADKGDLATVQDCLSKNANVEIKDVRRVFALDVLSGIFFDLHHAVLQ